MILAAVFAAICFVAGTNGITSSALSREGRQFYIMKMIPVSYGRQLMAKIMVGILLTLAGLVLTIGTLVVFLSPPPWLVGLIILIIPGAVLLPNLIGIIFELYWPKLNWENEQKAVKQNINVVFGMLFSFMFAGLGLAPIIVLKPSLPLALVYLIGVPLLADGVLVAILLRLGPKRMLAIDG